MALTPGTTVFYTKRAYQMFSVNAYLDNAVGERIGQGQHGGVDQIVSFS